MLHESSIGCRLRTTRRRRRRRGSCILPRRRHEEQRLVDKKLFSTGDPSSSSSPNQQWQGDDDDDDVDVDSSCCSSSSNDHYDESVVGKQQQQQQSPTSPILYHDDDDYATFIENAMGTSQQERSQMLDYVSKFLEKDKNNNNNKKNNQLQQQQQQQLSNDNRSGSRNTTTTTTTATTIEEGSSSSSSSYSRDDDDDNNSNIASSSSLYDSYTHLIAIPIRSCHDLTLELESVQRAILYHCPILVHACISPAAMRIPLLLVKTTSTNTNTNTNHDDNNNNRVVSSSIMVTQKLTQIVKEVIHQHVTLRNTYEDDEDEEDIDLVIDLTNNNSDSASSSSSHGSTSSSSRRRDDNNDPHRVARFEAAAATSAAGGSESASAEDILAAAAAAAKDDGKIYRGENIDGIRPVMVDFSTLEIDGKNNDVLYTTAIPDTKGTRLLQRIVMELQRRIEVTTDWNTILPPDPQQKQQKQQQKTSSNDQNNHDDDEQTPMIFRPRVPFMRLPPHWKQILKDEYFSKEEEEEEGNDDDDNDSLLMMKMMSLKSDQGGNGISPILWGQWMNDQFGNGGSATTGTGGNTPTTPIRMREIGIYTRRRLPSTHNSLSTYSRAPTTNNNNNPDDDDDHHHHDDDIIHAITEEAFHIPDTIVPLPVGNAALQRAEKELQNYQDERMKKAEEDIMIMKDKDFEKKDDHSRRRRRIPDNDPLLSKTRDRIHGQYTESKPTTSAAADLSELLSELMGPDNSNDNDDDDDDDDDTALDLSIEERPIDPNIMDNWMLDRIQKVVSKGKGQGGGGGGGGKGKEEEESIRQQEINNDKNDDINDAVVLKKNTNEQEDEPIDDWMRDRIKRVVQNNNKNSTTDDEDDDEDDEEEGSPMNDWMRNRINQIVQENHKKARDEMEKKMFALKKQRKVDIPPAEENPIFIKYKAGTLVDRKKTMKDASSSIDKNNKKPAEILLSSSPFPSNEHIQGFWRVVSSPTGFDVEDGGGGGDTSRSDNLILRVDGRIAGGPILDQDTRQKAAGGTWKLMRDDDDDENENVTNNTNNNESSLRIRLVIPPKKDRILVMHGKLERLSFGNHIGGDIQPYDRPRTTFAIPEVEERLNAHENAAAASAAGSGNDNDDDKNTVVEDLIYCKGDAWIEDAITGKNRAHIGTFAIMKLNVSQDPNQYTITIPKNVRNI